MVPCATSIEEAVQMAEARWSGYEFKITSNEAHSPCPICGEAKENGFVIFPSGYFFCRPGKHDGWLDDDKPRTLTPEQIAIRRHEAEIKAMARKQREMDARLSAVERLNRSNVHERYYNNLDSDGYEWWLAKGAELYAIHDYKLGYCSRCPTDKEHRPSYTIPIFDQSQTKLVNLRHRISHAENGDKYRPEMAGLGTSLAFAHHLIDAEMGIILEGSIKAMVCGQYGLPTVGIFGKRGRFLTSWLDMFPMGKPIYIGLDPDATESAERLGAGIAKAGKEVYVIEWPDKPDDMLVDGCTPEELMHYVHLGKRVH